MTKKPEKLWSYTFLERNPMSREHKSAQGILKHVGLMTIYWKIFSFEILTWIPQGVLSQLSINTTYRYE